MLTTTQAHRKEPKSAGLASMMLFVAFLSTSFLLSGCSKADTKAAAWGNKAVLVKVSKAETQTVTDSSIYLGTAKSRHSVALSPQIDGQVSKIFVQPGETVSKGKALMEISPEKQQASVNGSKYANWSSKKDLDNARKTLQSLESQKVAKISNLHLAESNRNRYNILCSSGAVSKMDYDQRVNAFEAAKADLDSTEAQIDAQQAAVEKMSQQVSQTGESLKEQQVQLQYYTIKAPFDAVVGEIPIKLGNYVNTNTILTTVTQNDPLEIYVELPVERAHSVKVNTDIQLLDQQGTLVGNSKIFFIAPNVSPDSQTILVKSLYQNNKERLKADQLVKARVVWSKHSGVTVPTEAVCHQSGEDFMFITAKGSSKDGTLIARQVPVKLGDIENSRYQVLKGIAPGDTMIVSGIQNLADKTPITVSQ